MNSKKKKEIKIMALENEDVIELIDILKGHFVQRSECNEMQKENNKKFANDDTRIRLFEQKMSQWEWLFKLIATGTIGTLVTSVLALIIK